MQRVACLALFESGIKTEATKETYRYYLKRFCKETKLSPEVIIELGNSNPKQLTDTIISFIITYKERVEGGEISGSTVQGFYKAVKLLCVMNDVILNWDKITRTLPLSNKGQDRAININEIRELSRRADVRARALVLLMASSGVRVGSIPDMEIGHLKPMRDGEGKFVAASLIVYAGDKEEYTTFITPEAYEAIQKYMEYRKEHGENINDSNPLFRHKIRVVKANKVKKLKRDAIRAIIHRLLKRSGVRKGKAKRFEFQADHGFRKFFKTRAEQVMRPLNVETLMGHSTGVAGKYYRPQIRELLDDYRKAIPLLTVEQPQDMGEINQELDVKIQNQQKQIDNLQKEVAEASGVTDLLMQTLFNSEELESGKIGNEPITLADVVDRLAEKSKQLTKEGKSSDASRVYQGSAETAKNKDVLPERDKLYVRKAKIL